MFNFDVGASTKHMSETDPLKTDCSKCAALCCMALAFDQGTEFAFNKSPGEPCRNLSGNRCSIHSDLAQKGFSGCIACDCLGAGNRVVQEVFGGRSWQQDARLVGPMIEAFASMREVHKRIDLLRGAETFALGQDDQKIRTQLLAQLEHQQWDEDALTEFHTGLALDVDIFMFSLKDYLPASLADEFLA